MKGYPAEFPDHYEDDGESDTHNDSAAHALLEGVEAAGETSSNSGSESLPGLM